MKKALKISIFAGILAFAGIFFVTPVSALSYSFDPLSGGNGGVGGGYYGNSYNYMPQQHSANDPRFDFDEGGCEAIMIAYALGTMNNSYGCGGSSYGGYSGYGNYGYGNQYSYPSYGSGYGNQYGYPSYGSGYGSSGYGDYGYGNQYGYPSYGSSGSYGYNDYSSYYNYTNFANRYGDIAGYYR